MGRGGSCRFLVLLRYFKQLLSGSQIFHFSPEKMNLRRRSKIDAFILVFRLLVYTPGNFSGMAKLRSLADGNPRLQRLGPGNSMCRHMVVSMLVEKDIL